MDGTVGEQYDCYCS